MASKIGNFLDSKIKFFSYKEELEKAYRINEEIKKSNDEFKKYILKRHFPSFYHETNLN